jgi:hypothetical protein
MRQNFGLNGLKNVKKWNAQPAFKCFNLYKPEFGVKEIGHPINGYNALNFLGLELNNFCFQALVESLFPTSTLEQAGNDRFIPLDLFSKKHTIICKILK